MTTEVMLAILQVTGIINEAKESILVLMKDAFGNYVVQKMLEKANAAERKWMLQCICGDRLMPNRVVALSKDHHSCRVIQTALQVKTCCKFGSVELRTSSL